MNGHNQPTHVDLGRGSKEYALRVAENQLAVGLDAAHDLARVGIQNPIERGRLGTWGDELHRLVTAHIEGVPVHDGLVGRLTDRHRTVIRLDAGLARDHLPSRGQDSLRAHGGGRRPNTRSHQQLPQKAGNHLGRWWVSAHVASRDWS